MDVLADTVVGDVKKIALKFYCLHQADKSRILKQLSEPARNGLEGVLDEIEKLGVEIDVVREFVYGKSGFDGDSQPGASWSKLVAMMDKASVSGQFVPASLLELLRNEKEN